MNLSRDRMPIEVHAQTYKYGTCILGRHGMKNEKRIKRIIVKHIKTVQFNKFLEAF